MIFNELCVGLLSACLGTHACICAPWPALVSGDQGRVDGAMAKRCGACCTRFFLARVASWSSRLGHVVYAT